MTSDWPYKLNTSYERNIVTLNERVYNSWVKPYFTQGLHKIIHDHCKYSYSCKRNKGPIHNVHK